jgi:hypothetical protein
MGWRSCESPIENAGPELLSSRHFRGRSRSDRKAHGYHSIGVYSDSAYEHVVGFLLIKNYGHEERVLAWHLREDPKMQAAAEMIRAAGYACTTVDGWEPFSWYEGYYVTCNRYTFEIQNHGGRWTVTPP